ncbi:MAG: ABC transporter substrate-binding protein [Pseudomonadota bacterium]
MVLLICKADMVQAASDDGIGDLAGARTVRLYAEDFPPFNFMDEAKLKGVGADIIHEMARLLDHDGAVEILPWKRVMMAVRENPYTAAFSTVRSPERENEFKWVGPIATVQTWLYQSYDNPYVLTTLDDARKVNAIGVQAGGAAERSLTQMGFDNLSALHNPGNALRLLLAGRIDVWETADAVFKYQLDELGVDEKQVRPTVNLGKYELYLAFSPQTPDEAILPWQHALEQLHASGVFGAIQRRYGLTPVMSHLEITD